MNMIDSDYLYKVCNKKIVILHKHLVFAKASFYQNDVLIILSKYQDLCLFWGYMQMYSGRHVVVIDFQLLGLKSGGILGTEIKILIFYIFTTYRKQFIIKIYLTKHQK